LRSGRGSPGSPWALRCWPRSAPRRRSVSKGGDPKGCRNIFLEYASGCAVLAWGGGFEQFASGPDDKDNADRAVRRCQERSGTACRVVYSGCGRPVDVGFCPKGVRPPHPSCGPPKR
jgi:hypothetical protein